jgi:hypothetical protein
MDATYFVAFGVAILAGFLVQIGLTFLRMTERFGIGLTFAIALALNIALVVFGMMFAGGGGNLNLGGSLGPPLWVTLLADAVLIPLVTVAGVVVGGLPAVILIGVARRLSGVSKVARG